MPAYLEAADLRTRRLYLTAATKTMGCPFTSLAANQCTPCGENHLSRIKPGRIAMPGDEHMPTCRADPVRADCPVGCLRAILSAHAFIPLSWAYMASYEPPRTVGEVARLHREGKLSEIRGLGPRRIGEIELCLILAGLASGHQHAL